MAQRISELTTAAQANDEDYLPIVQGGTTKKVAVSTLLADATAAVADDITKQGGTDINRVKGLNRVAFLGEDGSAPADAAAPPKGGAWVYSSRGATSGFRAKKPVPPGHWDLEDFGGAGDYLHGRTVTCTAASASITLSSTTGLFPGQRLRLNHTTTRTIQTVDSSTTATLTATAGVTTTGGACYTDNVDAFTALVAAAETFAPTDRGIGILAAGHFYFSDTVDILRRVDIRGVGQTDENKKPGTMFVFGADCDGFFFHSTLANDEPTSNAAYSKMSDCTIYCRDRQTTGNGVVVHVPITMVNVDVIGFAENGINLIADTSDATGNASGATFIRVRSAANGKHGIHIYGGDANSCSFIACSIQANDGVGIYDESGLGNYFAGIHCEGNTGDPCCQATTTSGSATISVDDSQHLWYGQVRELVDLDNEISIAGVTGTKVVTNIQYETRTSSVSTTTGNGVSPIVVTTTGAHGLKTDDYANITGVVGNTAANVTRRITRIDATSFSLNNTTGNGAYVSGGSVKDVFPSAVVTLDSTCDATVDRARVSNEDGQNHDYVIAGQGLTASTLIGCYAEAAINKIDVPSIVIGGNLAQCPNPGTGHMNNGGWIDGRPTRHINDRGTVKVYGELGSNDTNLAGLSVGTPDLGGGDYTRLSYNTVGQWWAWQNVGGYRDVVRWPTTMANWRRAAGWHVNGLFLGDGATDNIKVARLAGTSPQTIDYAGNGATYEVGDIVEQSNPNANAQMGSVCTTAGTQGTLVGITGSITSGTASLLVNDYTGMSVGMYVTIAGVTGAKKLLSRSGLTWTIDSNANATVAGAAVAFSPAVFGTLPPRSGVGTQAMADANQTPTAAVYGFHAIRTTGAIAANRDLVLPTLTDNTAREWLIINACTNAFSIVVKCASGTSVTIANGKSAAVWVDAAGVTRISTDA